MSDQTIKLIKENDVKWADLRFTDTKGKEQHLTVPSSEVSGDCSIFVSHDSKPAQSRMHA